jgi:hypothetical protein
MFRAKALSGLHKAATEEFIWNGVCGGDRKAEITSRNTVAGLVQRRDGVRKGAGPAEKEQARLPSIAAGWIGFEEAQPFIPFSFRRCPGGRQAQLNLPQYR